MSIAALALAAALLAATGYVFWTLGVRYGARLGGGPSRSELEAIAQAAAEASSRSSVKDFDRATGQAVERLVREARANREVSRAELEKTTAPLQESLRNFQELSARAQKQSHEDAGKVRQLATQLSQQMEGFRDGARSLREALKGDRQARGRWGEVQLKSLVEATEMIENCEFFEQRSYDGARPDLVVRLPGGAQLAVDSKAPMDAYLDAIEVQDAARQEQLFRAHAVAVRQHTNELAKKDYPERLGGGPKYTVLFLPMESLLAEAIRHDGELLRSAARQRIVLATPFTLLGLLWAVKAMWQHDTSTRNVREMRAAGLEVERRLTKLFEHLTAVERALTKTNLAWNGAIGSAERRLVPQLRKLRKLGDKSEDGSGPRPEGVDVAPRKPRPDLLDRPGSRRVA